LPRTSRLLEDTARTNGLNLLEVKDRQRLTKLFVELKKSAPVLTMSFASDPPPAVVQKLIFWLRREVHPLVLLQIGLQPSIAAGCVLRTPNHYFDFSLRRHFSAHRQLLIDKLRES
jgi:hypothetical protein